MMKRLLVMTSMILMMLCIQWPEATYAVEADIVDSGVCEDNLTWSLDERGTLTISGSGAMRDFYYSGSTSYPEWESPWHPYRASVKKIIIEEGVTRVGDFAFYACQNATEIVIADSVTSIGEWGFGSCSSITQFTISCGVETIEDYAFQGCKALKMLLFQGEPVQMGDRALYGLTAVASYPENSEAWQGCIGSSYGGKITWFERSSKEIATGLCGNNIIWSLSGKGVLTLTGSGDMQDSLNYMYVPWYQYVGMITEVVMEEGITSIGSNAFYKATNLTSVQIPSSVTHINSGAFVDCASLESIYLPDSMTTCSSYMFEGCTSLKEVHLPAGITSIVNALFRDCISLEVVNIPEGVEVIEEYAFERCTSLSTITIPKTVRDIALNAFSECDSLSQILVDDENNTYASDSGCVMFNKAKTILYWATSAIDGEYTIPKSVVRVENGAFSKCKRLTSIIIPDNVQEIGGGAFVSCTSLSSVSLPNTVTRISPLLFAYCSSLTQLVVPEDVYYIEESAFHGTTSLAQVFFMGDNPAAYDEDLFENGCESVTVYHLRDASGWDDETWCGAAVDVWNYTLSGTASCTQGGTQLFTDAEHDLVYNRVTSRPTHCYGECVVGKAPTSEEEGYWHRLCEKCGAAEIIGTIPKYLETEQRPNPWNSVGEQNYKVTADIIHTYLIKNPDGGYTRVEGFLDHVLVEHYDDSFRFISSKGIAPELPCFGGYYTDGSYHYLVYGQGNPEEDDNQEVLRVVKYTLNWERIGDARVYGSHIWNPFVAGSLRMTHAEGVLYIHTCTEMYAGLFEGAVHHQANMSFVLRTEVMEFAAIRSGVGHSDGYVSHSFNQFVLVDGLDVLTVDHGDAYPRAIVLQRFNDEVRNGEWNVCESVNVFEICGEIGVNATGVSLGGFEASNSAYMIAGNSIIQDGVYRDQRNIFVTITSKENFSEDGTEVLWLTNYSEGADVEVSTPQFMEVDKNTYLILWTEDKVLKYAFLDGNGQWDGTVYTADGALSDCKPIVVENRVVWYVTYGTTPEFFELHLQDTNKTLTSVHEHYYAYNGTKAPTTSSEGIAYFVCNACGDEKEIVIPCLNNTDFTVTVTVPSPKQKGTRVYVWKNPLDNCDYKQYTFIVPLTGWQKIGDNWYYCSPDGTALYGSIDYNGKKYSFDENGVMITGWHQEGTNWFYYNPDGDMALSWKKINGKWYYFDKHGVMSIGWKKINSKWYYFNPDGDMAISWKKISNKWYYFNIDGDMATNWKKINSKWYYFNINGDMQLGWKRINTKWYYFNADGDMHAGWKNIGGIWYYFNQDGDMHTGWKKLDGTWYYFNSEGNMHVGWKQLDGTWYYFTTDGAMVTGRYKINGTWNTFTSDGAWVG